MSYTLLLIYFNNVNHTTRENRQAATWALIGLSLSYFLMVLETQAI